VHLRFTELTSLRIDSREDWRVHTKVTIRVSDVIVADIVYPGHMSQPR
jgi:hypothetical protein